MANVYYFDRPTARDPNGSPHGQEVDPGPAPMPHQDNLKVLDAYYAWRRGASE